jgi:hypothetical protein
MPFTPVYKSTFTDGDLVYGLATTRSKLVIRFAAALLTLGGPATVDQYRKGTMPNMRKKDRTTWRAFLRENEAHKRYGRYGQAIRSFDNDEEKFAEATTSSAVQNAAWRAKSKFGMEWTLKNQRGQIHFVLDDIDMAAVVTKTHRYTDPVSGNVLAQDQPRGKAPTEGEKERTITHSELRWIYRNRQNPLVQAGVQFWITTGGTINPCGPPWTNHLSMTTMPTNGRVITWQQAWAIYKPETEPNTF